MVKHMIDIDSRLENYVANENDCWLWQGYTTSGGYGIISWKGTPVGVHRLMYELYVEPIPKGLEIDHLCSEPSCMNPKHMEPVTHAENQLRRAKRITHCVHEHEYTKENTAYYTKHSKGKRCRICDNLRSQEYRDRKKGIMI